MKAIMQATYKWLWPRSFAVEIATLDSRPQASSSSSAAPPFAAARFPQTSKPSIRPRNSDSVMSLSPPLSLPLSSSNKSCIRKFPPFVSVSELSSPSPALNGFPLFNRRPIRSPTWSLPILSNSNPSFTSSSSMSSGSDASSPDGLIDNCHCGSEAGDLGVSDSDDDEAPHVHAHHSPDDLPDRWHVVGLGQAMVDFSGMVDDEFLTTLGLEKGTRKVVNHEERGRVLRAMDGCSYKAAAGGSLSNTLVALARLGAQPIGGPALNVAMAGSVGSDPLGEFYRSKLRRANVNFLSSPVKDGTTGTVIVLTTPDAHRTMLAYQGTSSRVNYDLCLASLMSKTSILVVEGYLFEFPDTIKTIAMACEEARKNGALVAITASDVSCIERHYDDFWDIMASYADIIFANSDEARTFCHFSSKESPISATRYLSHFVPFVSVTDGPKGSYIGVKGEAIYIPPNPCTPVDTCGAGDAYASGILYGLLRGVSDLRGIGTLASKVASVVVAQQGTRLGVQDAVKLAQSFTVHQKSSVMWSDVGSDQISSL